MEILSIKLIWFRIFCFVELLLQCKLKLYSFKYRQFFFFYWIQLLLLNYLIFLHRTAKFIWFLLSWILLFILWKTFLNQFFNVLSLMVRTSPNICLLIVSLLWCFINQLLWRFIQRSVHFILFIFFLINWIYGSF